MHLQYLSQQVPIERHCCWSGLSLTRLVVEMLAGSVVGLQQVPPFRSVATEGQKPLHRKLHLGYLHLLLIARV